jgi:tetratricopeptide (TPR) repeat protein
MHRPVHPSAWKRDLLRGLLLLAAVFVVYQPAWHGQPVWDDDMHITPLPLRSAAGLAGIWTHSRATMQYFPLAHTVFWLGANLWGDSTWGYHLLSILLHAASALLLVRILRRLGIPRAWLAAAIFALHPVMVESVAWISELKNTLSGVLFFAAALAYLSYADGAGKTRYGLALGLFVLGLLAKATIAPFPLAMLAVLWWKHGRLSWKRDGVPLLPFRGAGLASGLLAVAVEQTHMATREAELALTGVERVLVAGRAVWFYAGKLLLPIDLVFSYPRWSVRAAVGWQYLFPAAVLAAGAALWAWRRARRGPLAAFLYFVAMLLPYLGFFRFYTFRYSFVADHYQYLAAVGPIVLAAGLAQWIPGRVWPRLAVGALLLALGAASWQQSGTYADAETLYRSILAKNDASWMAHNGLGILRAQQQRTDEASAHYRRALQLHPRSAEAHNNLGLLLAAAGRRDEAEAHYRQALALDPEDAKTHNNLGMLLAAMGRRDEAGAHYEQALRRNPDLVEANYNLGMLLADLGRTEEALARYRKVLALAPRHVGAHNNLGVLLASTGRAEEAMVHYYQALASEPQRADVHYNLGGLLEDRGRTDEALAHYQQAVALDPDRAELHYNLGLLLAKQGRNQEAMGHYRRALEIDPEQAEAHNNLGILLAGMRRPGEAVGHFRRALALDPAAVGFLKNLAVALAQDGQLPEATAMLASALARARAAGDEARERKLAQTLAMIRETFPPAGTKPAAVRGR